MPDNMSKEQRSYTMSRIRSRGNKTTEERLAKLFRTYGIKGWRRHLDLPGKPDFVFRKEKMAVFVDGCFWHGCPRCKLKPKTNIEYWTKKIRGNRQRDRTTRRHLEGKGWAVIRIWEHSLMHPRRIAKAIEDVLEGRRKNEICSESEKEIM